MLIKFTSNVPEEIAAYINPEYVSAVLPKRNILTGELMDGTSIYLVGGESPVHVKEEMEEVVNMIRRSEWTAIFVSDPPKEDDNGK